MSTSDIYNFRKVSDKVITGGHPTADNIRDVAAEGFRAVVNLAPVDGRSLADEDSFVQALGMQYHYIPVVWDAPKANDFATFERVLGELGDDRVLIHCAANYRVTAFYSLYAQKHLGWSAAEAGALRASIWQGSDYPIWDAFIGEIEETIRH